MFAYQKDGALAAFGKPVNAKLIKFHVRTQCLKITEKVAFDIASEASYVYILSGHKFIKNAKNGEFWRVF